MLLTSLRILLAQLLRAVVTARRSHKDGTLERYGLGPMKELDTHTQRVHKSYKLSSSRDTTHGH